MRGDSRNRRREDDDPPVGDSGQHLSYVNGPYVNCRLSPEGSGQTIRRWLAYGRLNSEWQIRKRMGVHE